MDRMSLGPRAHVGVCLMAAALICSLLSCAPMTEQGVAPLFKSGPAPSRTLVATTATLAPAPRTFTPKPVQTAHPLAPATMDAAAMAWLRRAGLTGDPAPGEVWETIRRAARAEGHVALYSDTARMLTALEMFLMANPGLDGEVRVVASDDAFRDLMKAPPEPLEESPDVYLGGDSPLLMQALAQNRLWSYVPADLQEALPERMREPLLVHHWSALLLMQRGTGGSASPIDNWWDLTREEWKGRIALSDPAIDKRSLYLLLAFAQHAEELAEAYRAEFGRELQLDEGCSDAGCQWVRLVLRNDPQLLVGDAEVAAWVSDPAASEVRLGICGSEQLAKVQRGRMSISPLLDVAPTAGLYWPTYLAMVVGGPHPNAARVMINWLMSDVTGEGASAAWFEAGHYLPQNTAPDPPGGISRAELEPRLWKLDAAYALDHGDTINGWIKESR